MSICMTLEDDIDISRGDMLVRKIINQPEQDINVMICWMNERKMIPRGKYTIRILLKPCIVKDVKYKMDINTIEMKKIKKLD